MSESVIKQTPRGRWLGIVTLVATLIVLYGDVLRDLARQWWTNPDASHGLLIPPLALYLAWLRRDATLAKPAAPSGWGVAGVALAALLFLLGRLGAEYFAMRFSFVLLLASLTAAFWGLARLRTLAFPFVLLVTMIPLPAILYNALANPLQLLASNMAASACHMAGVSVYQDGNIIQLAGTSLGVAEACSGLRSLSSLLVAGLLLGYLICRSLPARIAVFLCAVPIAIGMNVLRVALTAILADSYPSAADGFYHSFSGWLIFSAGFGCTWAAAKLIRWSFER